MKAVFRFAQEKGGIEIREMPIPEIGDGDVLIKVMAAGLCGSDLNSYLGRSTLYTPVIMGHEFSGEIADVGSRVENWKVGDRGLLRQHGLRLRHLPGLHKGRVSPVSEPKGTGLALKRRLCRVHPRTGACFKDASDLPHAPAGQDFLRGGRDT